MSATNATRSVTRDGGACLDYADATIPLRSFSESLATRIGNSPATRGGEPLRAGFDLFCPRLYRRMEDRDPGTAGEFRRGLNRCPRDAGEREIVWTRE